jgi:ubiquinone/menaquinone biosynthesis C-methylase UbiE
MKAAAFDDAARDYDHDFVHSPLGRELRAAVWERLSAAFRPGDRVLELNCGTGEDAIWMAKKGIRVTATDISNEMLDLTTRKARAHEVEQMVTVRRLDISQPQAFPPNLRFDGVLSNFGGLNCVGNLGPLAMMLAKRVVPGGTMVLVLMARFCLWEMAWNCIRLHPATAFRRLGRNGAKARVGSQRIRIWYPSAATVRRSLAPWFRCRGVSGLGVFLPPTYLRNMVTHRPRLFRTLSGLDRRLASRFPFTALGDHAIFEFVRTGENVLHG